MPLTRMAETECVTRTGGSLRAPGTGGSAAQSAGTETAAQGGRSKTCSSLGVPKDLHLTRFVVSRDSSRDRRGSPLQSSDRRLALGSSPTRGQGSAGASRHHYSSAFKPAGQDSRDREAQLQRVRDEIARQESVQRAPAKVASQAAPLKDAAALASSITRLTASVGVKDIMQCVAGPSPACMALPHLQNHQQVFPRRRRTARHRRLGHMQLTKIQIMRMQLQQSARLPATILSQCAVSATLTSVSTHH